MSKIKELDQSTAIAIADPKLPTTPTTSTTTPDPFEAYANAVSPQNIIGTLLKFVKGDFLAGKDGDVIPTGTKFTANLDLMAVGWVKWSGGRPVEHALVRVGDGVALPTRKHLSDYDNTDTWDIGINGKPRDPWQAVNYLPLLDETGQIFTFAISSTSAIKEVGSLCRAFAHHRKSNPDELPIIELNVGSYLHPDKSIGRVKFPELNIVGWTSKTQFAKALASIGLMSSVPTSASPPMSSNEEPPLAEPWRNDDDEEIPL